MATVTTEPLEELEQSWYEPPGLISWFTTVDHKRIGMKYLVTALLFFVLGGVESLIMRAQLGGPELHLLSPEAYNQLFTMHGVTMMFLFAMPVLSGFGNFFVPLMIGAGDASPAPPSPLAATGGSWRRGSSAARPSPSGAPPTPAGSTTHRCPTPS